MGNRAVITFSQSYNSPCIYLHWNGGRASVEGFLQAARDLGVRRCNSSAEEGLVMDALAAVIARPFFGNDIGFMIYRETYGRADKDNWDNGTYLLNRDMTIGGRLFAGGSEEVNAEKTKAIYEQIMARAAVYDEVAA